MGIIPFDTDGINLSEFDSLIRRELIEKIEAQQRLIESQVTDIERLSRINSDLCRTSNQRLIAGARFEEQIDELREQLSAAQHERNICQAECIRLTNDYNAKLSAAQADNEQLVKALEAYANPDNWLVDEEGIYQRVWKEPDSATPEAYDGHSIADKAITAHKARKDKA